MNSPKCLVYRLYKTQHLFEEYLDIIPLNLAYILCRFRTMNRKSKKLIFANLLPSILKPVVYSES